MTTLTPSISIPDFLTELTKAENSNESLYNQVNSTPIAGHVDHLIPLFRPVRELLQQFELLIPEIDDAFCLYGKIQISLSLLCQFSNTYSEAGFNDFLTELGINPNLPMIAASLELYEKTPLEVMEFGTLTNTKVLANFFDPLKDKFESRDMKKYPQLKASGFEFLKSSYLFDQWAILMSYQLNQLALYLEAQTLQTLTFKHPELLDELKSLVVYFYHYDKHTTRTMDMFNRFLLELIGTVDDDTDNDTTPTLN